MSFDFDAIFPREKNKRKKKYNNKEVWHDGIKFDSTAEGNYYLKLKKDPLVESFTLQPKFLLIPKFRKDDENYRARYYIADFDVRYRDGSRLIIDVKGYQTALFLFKARLWDHLYPDLHLKLE